MSLGKEGEKQMAKHNRKWRLGLTWDKGHVKRWRRTLKRMERECKDWR